MEDRPEEMQQEGSRLDLVSGRNWPSRQVSDYRIVVTLK